MVVQHGHSCEATEVYAMVDVTVWIRIKADGSPGGMRETRKEIADEARAHVGVQSDFVCASCGWMGRDERV